MTPLQRANYYKVEGDCHFGKDRFAEALVSYRTSRALFARDTTSAGRAKFVNLYTSIAYTLVSKGDFREANDTAQLAFRLALDTTGIGTASQQHALRAISLAAERLGDYDAALAASRTALDIIERTEGVGSPATGYVHNQLGVTYSRLGRFVEAGESYRKAVDIFTERFGADSKLAMAALSNLASTNEILGHEDMAISVLMRKLEIYRRDPTSDRLATVTTLEQLASAQRRIGDLEAALHSNTEAISLLREIDGAPGIREVSLLTKTSNLQLGMLDVTLAAPNIERAFDLLSRIPDPPALERAKLLEVRGVYEDYIGEAKLAASSFAEAYQILREADVVFHRDAVEIFPRYIRTTISLGNTQVALDTLASLTQALDKAAPGLSGSLRRSLDAMLLTLRAEAYLSLQRLPADWRALNDSLTEQSRGLYRLVADLPSSRHQRELGAHVAAVGPVYGVLAAMSLRAQLEDPSLRDDDVVDCLARLDRYQEHISELARPVSLLGIRPEDRLRVRALGERLAGYEQLLAEESGTGFASKQTRANLLDSAATLRSELARIPTTRPRVEDPSGSIRAGRKRLAKDRLLLTFHLVGRDLVALACTRDTMRLRRVGLAADIQSAAVAYVGYCRSPSSSFSANLDVLKQGAQLYQALVGWLGEEQLRQTPRLTVVGSQQVNGLPFAALPRDLPAGARGFREIDFAVSSLDFSFARSVSDALSHTSSSRPKLTVAVIAPDLGATNPGQGLPAIRAEVDSLRAYTDARVIAGPQATFEGLLLALTSANTLHLATHASNNMADGDYSYIVLSDSTGLQTRRIYAQALAELPLEANLVVLSACETGSGRSSLGLGVLSLANVFRDAGVQTVISTLWRVDDRQTVGIIAQLYKGLNEDQLPVDLALSAAQRHYLANTGSQLLHPYYWAAYAVSGDLRPFGKTSSWLLYGGILAAALLFSLVGLAIIRHRRRATFGRDAA